MTGSQVRILFAAPGLSHENRSPQLDHKSSPGREPAFLGGVANCTSETIAVEQVVPACRLIAKHPTKDDCGEDDSDGNELIAVRLLLLRLKGASEANELK